MIRNSRRSHILPLVILTLFSVIVLIPVVWMVSTSLKTTPETFTLPPRIIPETLTFEAYLRIWSDYPMGFYFRNSAIIVFASTTITLVFSTLAGFGLSRFKLKGAGAFLTFLLVTQMFPSIMLLIPFFQMMKTWGLINTHLGLIVAYIAFRVPLCSWLMLGYFESIPKDLDAAASIDGLSKFQTFLRIVLPLSLPGVAATGIYAFFESWNEYLFALVLTTSETMKTLPVGVGQLIGQYRIQWNDLMSASITASVPLLIVFLFLQRYLLSGLTAGAVKQ